MSAQHYQSHSNVFIQKTSLQISLTTNIDIVKAFKYNLYVNSFCIFPLMTLSLLKQDGTVADAMYCSLIEKFQI